VNGNGVGLSGASLGSRIVGRIVGNDGIPGRTACSRPPRLPVPMPPPTARILETKLNPPAFVATQVPRTAIGEGLPPRRP
jgi:hypothetical protein